MAYTYRNIFLVSICFCATLSAQQQLNIDMSDGRIFTDESGTNNKHLGLCFKLK